MPFDKYTPFMEAMRGSTQRLKTILPSRKAFDTARYGGVSSATQQFAPITGGRSSLGTLTVPYGGSTRYEKFHPGVDIANKIGTPIQAFMGGEIVSVVRGKKHGEKGFGNYIMVRDKQGGLHRYSHLNRSYVNVGQKVPRGAIIGGMGTTGSTYSLTGGTGSHLDYRVKGPSGQYVNPLAYVIKNISAQYARR